MEDRLSARDRQGVEGADGPLGVLQKIREIWRAVAVADAVHDAEVDLERLLDVEEDAPDGRRLVAAGESLDGAIGDQVDVELRPEVLHEGRQMRSEAGPAVRHLGIELHVAGEVVVKEGSAVARGEREA